MSYPNKQTNGKTKADWVCLTQTNKQTGQRNQIGYVLPKQTNKRENEGRLGMSYPNKQTNGKTKADWVCLTQTNKQTGKRRQTGYVLPKQTNKRENEGRLGMSYLNKQTNGSTKKYPSCNLTCINTFFAIFSCLLPLPVLLLLLLLPQVLHEGSVEPHRVCSPSSSDSFSTANCSLASSATYIRSEASRPRQQAAPEQESGQHSTGVRKTDRQARRPERSHRDRKARHKHGCGHRKNSTSPPIFQLVTPPRLFQLSQGRHLKKSREASDDDDDISGLHGGSQAEEDETVDLSEWLSSTFKSWLPDFGSKREEKQKTSEQRPERRENSSHFERFDVRNILGTDHQIGQERFASEPKACPHSCVSSLCNFRRTLESWKKQLLAMHAALDASSAAISQRHCVYCDEDYHSRGPHQDCYTMHIAQEFWRTVLQFKRSHLESSECPYTGQHNSGRGSENDSGERDEQCSLGHRHSCSSDYSGCSQHQNSPVSEDVHEAPCVHVLLDDVDLLLKKLENLKQSSSPRKSKLSQTDSLSNTKMSEKVESYKGQPSLSCCHKNYLSDSPVSCGQSDARIPNKVTQHGDPPTLDERGRSTASMISPSPSISLAEELADLAELTGDEHCTDDEGSEKFLEHELARTEPVSSAAKASSTNETPVLNQDALLSGANSPQVSSHAKLCELSNRLKSLAKKLGDHVEADDCTVSENDHSTDVQSSETSQTDDHASTECPKNVSGASSATKTSLVKQGVLMPQARSLFVQPDSRLLELQSCPISLAEIPKDLEEPTVPIFSRKKICVHDQSSSSEKPTKLDNVPIECPYSAADDNSARKSRVIEDVPIMRAMSHDDELCANDQSSQKPKELENALTECPRSDSEMISGTILPLKNEEFPEPSAGLSQASSDFIYFHLPNLPTSLADSWADLKESCESILNRKEHCANNENSESPSPRQLESGPQKIPQSTSSLTHSSPHNEETMIPRAKSPQVLSDTRLLQLLTLSELPALAGEQRCVSRSEELAISRTRSLGKFALRYLDHIEQKLEANDLLTLGLEMASPKPTQGGDPPKPMPRAILKGGPTTSQTQFSGETPTPRKRQTDTVASHSGSLKEQQFSTVKEELKPWQNLPLRHVQALFSDDSNVDRAQFGHAWRSDTDQQDSRAPRGNPLGNSHTAQKEPSVIAAFQDIISELNKLQSGQPVARSRPPENAVDQGDKSARSVKFDTSSLRRSHSYANACPRHMNSPPLQPAVLSSSSCLSLTTSGEDVCERDLTVTQAFDQLDKVVDDLLKLISIQNFS